MKIGLLLLFLSCSIFSYNALPPLAQSAVEVEAILKDPRLHQYLTSAEVIHEIQRSEEGYIVCTNHYFMKVDVHYLPAEGLGPAHFELEFYPAQEYLP